MVGSPAQSERCGSPIHQDHGLAARQRRLLNLLSLHKAKRLSIRREKWIQSTFCSGNRRGIPLIEILDVDPGLLRRAAETVGDKGYPLAVYGGIDYVAVHVREALT